MTDPNRTQHDDSEAPGGQTEPQADHQPDPQAGPDPTSTTAPTEPIAPVAGTPPADPAAAPGQPGAAHHRPPLVAAPASTGPQTVEVRRKWLVGGAVVGAIACLGLAFGAGYVTGDHTGGHHRQNEARYERGATMRGFMGQERNGLGGQRWRMMPPGSANGDGQTPGQQNQTPDQNQTPGQQTPGQSGSATTTPGTSS